MKHIFLSFALFLSACGQTAGLNLAKYSDVGASRDQFNLCHGYGCSHQTQSYFTPKEWKAVQRIFRKKSKTATIEREKIAKAIALMEKQMGAVTGTQGDLPKAPIKRQSVMELDCIDETINTTKYLNFLAEDGLLKFHRVGQPVYKGLIFNGIYPHNSASIMEIETGDVYVIDSYIYANGIAPDVRSLESWLKYRVEDID